MVVEAGEIIVDRVIWQPHLDIIGGVNVRASRWLGRAIDITPYPFVFITGSSCKRVLFVGATASNYGVSCAINMLYQNQVCGTWSNLVEIKVYRNVVPLWFGAVLTWIWVL